MSKLITSLEIERKWRLPKLPPEIEHSDYKKIPCVKLVQGYLVIEKGVELRLRREGSKYFATRKRGNGVVREEKQVPINESAFTLLTAGFTEGQLVQKWRFYYQLNGFMLEFDLFEGHLQGLVTLEVEFKSVEEASTFSLPVWIIGAVEVTGDSKYANKNLALHGLP